MDKEGKYIFKPPYRIKGKNSLLQVLKRHDLEGKAGILMSELAECLANSEKYVKVREKLRQNSPPPRKPEQNWNYWGSGWPGDRDSNQYEQAQGPGFVLQRRGILCAHWRKWIYQFNNQKFYVMFNLLYFQSNFWFCNLEGNWKRSKVVNLRNLLLYSVF